MLRHRWIICLITRGPTDATSEELRPFICNIQQFGTDRGAISAAKVASNSLWYPSLNKVISILFALQDEPVSQSREKRQETKNTISEIEKHKPIH